MDIVPQINQKIRYSWDIDIHSYLRDHHFEGKVILPAVEALIILAKVVKFNFPRMDFSCLLNAHFPRFLLIDPTAQCQAALVDIEKIDNGNLASVLLTSAKSKKGSISRTLEHARVEFGAGNSDDCPKPPFRILEKLDGQCISIPSATIYRELVPFGEAYQNIVGDLSVSYAGALAYLSGGDYEADENLLGSPFVFDAVMHMACVWGQRFTDIVPFPVGFKKRMIYEKTKKGADYLGRVAPADINNQKLTFDAWIYDANGVMCEAISSIQMRDVTQGRLRPPQWVKA
jgi:Polyketide synthase dehydratase N-terminal domain